jgi:plasmid stabilization system protein ParE
LKVVFSPQALADLEATIGFIRDRDWNAAARLAERVLEVIDRIADRAFEGPEIVLSSGERVRSWPVPPLRVYYQHKEGALQVLRIYHQARGPLVR